MRKSKLCVYCDSRTPKKNGEYTKVLHEGKWYHQGCLMQQQRLQDYMQGKLILVGEEDAPVAVYRV